MPVIDSDLVRILNSGRSVAIVGAGPSIEMGLPSWKKLAQGAIELMSRSTHDLDIKKAETLLAKEDYPSVFSKVEAIVGRSTLIQYINSAINVPTNEGDLYDIITAWPFSFYLTTNFDDLLTNKLNVVRPVFSVRLNTRAELSLIRNDTKEMVFKIHGSTTEPENIVLTAEQYEEFSHSDSRTYWRDRISNVLSMFDTVIIGYSVKDPDFREQLERAKAYALPNKPIFMFAAGMSDAEIKEYFLNFNIRVISYDNDDGNHHDLIKVMRRYEPFIAKDVKAGVPLEPINDDEIELASAIYLFTNLRLVDGNETTFENAYAAAILETLLEGGNSLERNELEERIRKRLFASSNLDPKTFEKALANLGNQSLISVSGRRVTLALPGKEKLTSAREKRKEIAQKFEEACRIIINTGEPKLKNDRQDQIIAALQLGLVQVFRRRGLEIARSVLLSEPIDPTNGQDILRILNTSAESLDGLDTKSAFADLMLEILLHPTKEIKEYLALLSQGYFAFHALGLDPNFSSARLTIEREKTWILDSSVLIRFLAIGNVSHNYARDLMNRGKELGLKFVTTENLLREVITHANWAFENFSRVPITSPDIFLAASGEAGYSHNLFLEGFLAIIEQSGNPSLRDYFDKCFGENATRDLEGAIKRTLEGYGISILEFEETSGIGEPQLDQRDSIYFPRIREIRRGHATYKNDQQCIAEAEVVLICGVMNARFVSLSTVLNSLSGEDNLAWRPEAFYRYLSLFTNVTPDKDLLYASMMQDLFSSGLDIVDTEALARFAAPFIRQTRLNFEKEREHYEDALGKGLFQKLVEGFEKVPDEKKPFYSFQFSHLVAAREREKRVELESTVFLRKQQSTLSDHERVHYERLKAKKKEKERDRLRKRRARQSGSGKRKKR